MKAALFRLYFQTCQYPWHLLFNLGTSGILYLISMAVGPRLTRPFVHSRSSRYPLKYFVADRVLTCVVGSMLLVLAAALIVRENNVVFIVLGVNYFFWFLFFPFHLLVRGLRGRRIEISKVLLAAVLLAVMCLSSFYFPEHLVVRHYRIETNRLNAPVRIVHLSDIHCERYGVREVRIVAAVNRLKPDLILVTGDNYNAPREYNKRGFAAAQKLFRGMNARLGIWAVGGHHDVFYNEPPLNGEAAGGIRYLNNETVDFRADGINLSVSGVKPYNRGWLYPRDTMPGDYRVFLAHVPAWIDRLAPGDFDLALIGHTHAGQIYVPFLLRLFLDRYLHGWYRKDQTRVYVHAGLGMDGFLAPRIRWFTYPEIVVIDLAPVPE